MTNKEVISFMGQIREILLADKSWLESTREPINEAFDLAISALEQLNNVPSAQPEETCESCLYRELDWHEEPCDSCTVGGESSYYKPSTERRTDEQANRR